VKPLAGGLIVFPLKKYGLSIEIIIGHKVMTCQARLKKGSYLIIHKLQELLLYSQDVTDQDMINSPFSFIFNIFKYKNEF
jgi:hypothetical protein